LAKLTVDGNQIYATNPSSSGIRVYNAGGATTIRDNDLHMNLDWVDANTPDADFGGIVLNTTDNALVSQNRVTGTHFCAVCIMGSSNTSVLTNDISGFSATTGLTYEGVPGADLVLADYNGSSSNNNLVVTSAASITDAGTGNRINGPIHANHAVGRGVCASGCEH
jgi:hypothetical protein